MITAILTAAVVWCMFYGRVPSHWLVFFCIALGICLTVLKTHTKHTDFYDIDSIAQMSRLNKAEPTLKFITAIVLMLICVSSSNVIIGGFLFVIMLSLIVVVGGLNIGSYIRLMSVPVSFLALSSFAILLEVTSQPVGVIHFNVFGAWLCIGRQGQLTAALVMVRALGAISCLYMFSLTTPMSEAMGVLRRLRCPSAVISLMYLIYRYMFILLSMYHAMKDAADSRLGYVSYRTGLRTTGSIYSNLLARSYRQAGLSFDAMESRCFETEIRFLDARESVCGTHALAAVLIVGITLSLRLLIG